MANMEMTSPLISIIVPVYKVEAYLRKCVDSIIAQTYKNLEIILMDDGSPDNYRKLLKIHPISIFGLIGFLEATVNYKINSFIVRPCRIGNFYQSLTQFIEVPYSKICDEYAERDNRVRV